MITKVSVLTEGSVWLADRNILKSSVHLSRDVSHEGTADLVCEMRQIEALAAWELREALQAAAEANGVKPEALAAFRAACESRLSHARERARMERDTRDGVQK